MELIRVKNWDKIYENNKTRILKNLDRIQIPINWGSDGYLDMMEREDGSALFGAWIALIQVAAKCNKRGTLVRSNGLPHTQETISRLTRIPVETIKNMLDFSVNVSKWLEIMEMAVDGQQSGIEVPDEAQRSGEEGSTDRRGQERIGMEGKEGEELSPGTIFEKPIEIRKAKFAEKIQDFSDEYPGEMLTAFFDWFGEPTQNKKFMRFEIQDAWDLSGRLRSWKRRDDEKKNGDRPKAKSFADQEYEKHLELKRNAAESRRKREQSDSNQ